MYAFVFILSSNSLLLLTSRVALSILCVMANKSTKSKPQPMRIYVRLWPEHDPELMAYLREKARIEDRSLAWVLKRAAKREMEANGDTRP
jgi:hypothetical protein